MGLEGLTHEGVSLHDYLRVIRRRKWIFLGSLVLVPFAALMFALRQTPLYQATSEVLITNQNVSAAVTGIDSNAYVPPDRLAQTQADLARLPAVADATTRAANIPMSAREFLSISSATPRTDADLIDLQVTDESPDRAVKLVTAYARQFAKYRFSLDTQTLDEALRGVDERLAELEASGRDDTPLYNTFLQRQQQLEELKALQGQSIYPVREALSASKVQPRPLRDLVIGLLLGIVLGLGLTFLREALDTRVRSAEDVAEGLGLTLLARVPSPPRRLAAKDRLIMLEDPTSPNAEAFRVLRTNLDFVNLDRHARVLMVTSALESEGKSTTAANLALALARAGKHVVLADLDLRRPYLDRFFQLGGRPGLTQVALGHVELEDALATIAISDPGGDAEPEYSNGNGRGRVHGVLEVLPSGPIPPDAGEFVGTHAVAATIQQLRDRADIVVVDAPPLLNVGDAMALTSRVDGILLVTRLKVLRRATVKELRRVLDNAPASALGFVVTSAESEKGEAYGYGYGYGYGHGAAARRSSERGREAHIS